MNQVYRTKDGDVLDMICHQYYADVQMISMVLEANPKLAEQDAVLPSGILITLPIVERKPEIKTIKLWD